MSVMREKVQSVWILCLTLFFANIASAETSVLSQWKTRGLQAVERGDVIGKELSKLKGRERMNRTCEFMLESGYAMHQSENPMVQKESRLFKHFHLLLNDEGGLFDIQYLYEHSGTLLAAKIALLPKDWEVLHQVLAPSKLQVLMPAVTPDLAGCIFEFDLSDPFAAKVLP